MRISTQFARKHSRAAAAALIAASSSIAMFSPSDAAYGATFTFATNFADMGDSFAWTPNGIPGAGDVAFIRRRGAGDTTTVDLTLDNGSITIGGIQYDTGLQRRLFNSVVGTTSTITFSGLPNGKFIEHTLTNGTLGFISAQTGFLANNDTGQVTLNTGTLNVVLAANGDFDTNNSVNILFDSDVSEIGGPHAIRKTSAGSVIFAGNNSLGGSIEAHQGNVVFDFTDHTGQKINSTGSLIFTGGTLVQNGNATQDITQTVNGAYLNSGQSVIAVNVSGAGQMSSTLDVGQFHRTKGGYLNINYTPNASIPASVPRVIATNTNTNGMIGAWLTVGNNDWAVNDGANNIIPMPSASYQAENNPANWQTNANVTQSTSFSGTLPASVTINSLRFNTSGAQTVTVAGGQTLTLDSGGIVVTGTSGNPTITGGNLTTGSQLPDELVAIIGGGKTLTINSTIANNSPSNALTFNKLGSGTVVLSGANTFTGGVILNTGTINVMGATALASAGSPSPLGSDGLISMGGPNSVLLVGSTNFSGSLNFNRNFQFNEGVQTLQINATAANSTISLGGTVTGTGGVVKGGNASATLLIPGAKDFSGVVLANTGMISVDTIAPNGTPSGLGTGTMDSRVILGNGAAGTLEFTGNASVSTSERTLQASNGSGGGSINLVMTQPVTLNWNGDMLWNSGQPLTTTSDANGTTITFNVGPTNARPFRIDTPGTIIFNGSIGVGTGVWGRLQKEGSGMLILNGQNGYAIGTTVNAGTLITATNLSNGTVTAVNTALQGGLTIASGATARVLPKASANDPSGTTVLPTMFISSTGTLDLSNNALVEDYPDNTSSPASTRRTLLLGGFNNGAWNGPGITSSSAAAQAGAMHTTAIGYAEASDVLTYSGGSASFAGVTLAEGNKALLLRYTWSGDANLDGVVNALDFNALATGFGQNNGSQVWVKGDFNYDGTVNTFDFNMLATNFNANGALPGGALGALVPEPSSMLLIVFGTAFGMKRRRKAHA
jgi:autotransporter-associated beta strand protein